MKKKKIKYLRWGGSLIFLALISNVCFGATFYIGTKQVGISTPMKKHDNATHLDANAKVEVFYGSPAKPNAQGAGSVPITFDTGNTNLVIDSNGDMDFDGVISNPLQSSLTVRIWEGSPGSGSNAYYIDVPYTIQGKPTEVIYLGGKVTGILNDIPPVPADIKDFSEKLQRRPLPSAEYDLQLLCSIVPPVTAAPIEGYEVQVVKDNPPGSGSNYDAWSVNIDTFNYFKSGVGVATPVNDYYVRGAKYMFRVRSYNHLGALNSWKEPPVYQSVIGGVVSNVTESWTFKKGVTGINTFAIPFDPLKGEIKGIVGNDETVLVAKDGTLTVHALIKEINRQASGNVVTTFGWWNETDQKHAGLTSISEYNNDGTVKTASSTGDPDFNLILATLIKTNQPYQVSVNQEKTFKLKGFK